MELFSLDIGRLVFTSIFFLIYLFFCIKTKKPFYITTLFLLIAIPFNISLQQPNFNVYIQGFSSNYIVPTLSIIDIFIFLILIFSLKGKKFSKNTATFFRIFFLFLTAKAFLDNDLLSTLLIYRTFFYSLALAYVFQNFSFKKNTRTISLIILFSVSIQAIIGIVQFNLGRSIGLHFLGESSLVKGMFGTSFINLNEILFLRSYGTFPHPNVLAGFCLAVLFFAICNLKKEKINILTALISTILIFFTFSRIVIALAVFLWIGFLIYRVKNLKKRKKKERQITMFSAYPIFLTRFSNLFLENDGSFSDRVELLKTAQEIIKNYPYFGIGVGNFVRGLDHYPVYTQRGFLLLQPVHNVFLLFLSEYGFVFGIPLIFLILGILTKAFLKGGILIKYMVFSLLVVASFDHYLITLPQGLILFIGVLIFFQNSQRFLKV